MKKCPNCEALNETSSKFCKKCGKSFLNSKNPNHKNKFSKKFIIIGIVGIIILIIGLLAWHQHEASKVSNQVKNHGYVVTLENKNTHGDSLDDFNANLLIAFDDKGHWSGLEDPTSYFQSNEMNSKINSEKNQLINNHSKIIKQFKKQAKMGNPLKVYTSNAKQLSLGLDFSHVKLSEAKKKQAQKEAEKEYPKIKFYNLKKTKYGFYGQGQINTSGQKKNVNVKFTQAY